MHLRKWLKTKKSKWILGLVSDDNSFEQFVWSLETTSEQLQVLEIPEWGREISHLKISFFCQIWTKRNGQRWRVAIRKRTLAIFRESAWFCCSKMRSDCIVISQISCFPFILHKSYDTCEAKLSRIKVASRIICIDSKISNYSLSV